MEKRKNNVALRAAIVLCVLALFCAAFVGGTFAKYTTNDMAMDSARVAKWGINVVAGGSLFGAHYAAGATVDSIVATASQNVAAFNGTDNIVAPGTTSDEGITIKLTGTPEVAYDVTATSSGDVVQVFLGTGDWGVMVVAEGVTEDNYTYNATTPVYYVLDGTSYVPAGATYGADFDVDEDVVYYELHDAVTLAADYLPMLWTVEATGKLPAIVTDADAGVDMRDLTTVVAAINDNLSAADGNANVAIDGSYTLKWAWAFDEDDDVAQNSAADTILGNLAAGDGVNVVYRENADSDYSAPATSDYSTNVHYDINVTVVQLDGDE